MKDRTLTGNWELGCKSCWGNDGGDINIFGIMYSFRLLINNIMAGHTVDNILLSGYFWYFYIFCWITNRIWIKAEVVTILWLFIFRSNCWIFVWSGWSWNEEMTAQCSSTIAMVSLSRTPPSTPTPVIFIATITRTHCSPTRCQDSFQGHPFFLAF